MSARFRLRPRRPRAVLDEVPADKQAFVIDHARASCARALAPAPPACEQLLRALGQPDFYDSVAKHNVARAADWQEMARVQRQFQEAEVAFDPRTRAYSESMRLTLHAATLLHMRDVIDLPADRHLFEAFLELHVTAFHENGAWFGNMHIAWCGALDVVRATRLSMLAHAPDLHDGRFATDSHTVRAAEMIRAARRSALGR